jgi:hypothetical protein
MLPYDAKPDWRTIVPEPEAPIDATEPAEPEVPIDAIEPALVDPCPVPDLTTVRCAPSPPVVCYSIKESSNGPDQELLAGEQKCHYDSLCYASVAGFNVETECNYIE